MRVRSPTAGSHLGRGRAREAPARSRPLREVYLVATGTPVPQGSKRIGRNRRTGAAVILDDPRTLKGWRSNIAWRALEARRFAGIRAPFPGPVEVEANFYFTRPISAKRMYPSVRPDLDKLVRALLDALKRTILNDDSQVVVLKAYKSYVTHDEERLPGVVAKIRELP
jgi:Holliday junction resolvase RusA-like endonuclease